MMPATRRLLAWMLPLLLLAGVLRLIGIGHGLPFALMGGADLVPGILPGAPTAQAGVLLPWLQLVVCLPVVAVSWLTHGLPGGARFDWVLLDSAGAMMLAARLVSLAFSLATVALVALTARRLFDDRLAGIVAGLLMATSWLACAYAHSAGRWSAMAFFIWLAIYIAVRYGSRPGPRRALLLGLAGGLGFGTGLAGGLGLLAGLVVHLARYKTRALNRNLAWLVGPAVLLGAFFTVLAVPTEQPGEGVGAAVRLFLETAWWADPVLLLGGLPGMVLLLRRHVRLVGLMLAAVVLWTLVAAWTGLAGEGALLPVLPVFALAAGGGALWLSDRLPQRPALIAVGLGGLALLYPLVTAAGFSLLLAADDTREQAADWLEANLAAGSAVVVDLAPVTVPASLDGLLDQELYLPGTLDSRMRLALEGGWPGDDQPVLRTVNIDNAAPQASDADAGRALFATLREAGYDTFAIGLSEEATPSGLQRAVLAGYETLALFLSAEADDAPATPDLAGTGLVDGPVWRLLQLDRLGPSVLVARVGAP